MRCLVVAVLFCVAMAQEATVTLMIGNYTHQPMQAYPAEFGTQIAGGAFFGVVVPAVPADGCKDWSQPVNETYWIALIMRGNCYFDQKVYYAQRAGASVCIIVNTDPSGDTLVMGGSPASSKSLIPSVSVGLYSGMLINETVYQEPGVVAYVTAVYPQYVWQFNYMVFVYILAAAIVLTIIAVIGRGFCRRRNMQHPPLPRRLVLDLPLRPFVAGEERDTCTICIEEFKDAEMVRVLPCSHLFHPACIDPWLTETRSTCPVCNHDPRKGVPAKKAGSETTPLLAETQPTSDDASSAVGESIPLADAAGVGYDAPPEVAEPATLADPTASNELRASAVASPHGAAPAATATEECVAGGAFTGIDENDGDLETGRLLPDSRV